MEWLASDVPYWSSLDTSVGLSLIASRSDPLQFCDRKHTCDHLLHTCCMLHTLQVLLKTLKY